MKNNNYGRLTDSEKKAVKAYLLYSFSIAWAAELALILLYKTGLLSGSIAWVLHFGIIGFGAGMAPVYAAFIVKKKQGAITLKAFIQKIIWTESLAKSFGILILFGFIQFCACAVQEKPFGNPWYYFILFMPLMILGGGLEEAGWQGIFQPLLQKRFPFLTAALIEGIIWSIWHLPLWLVPNSSQSSYNFIAFTLFCITLGVTLAAAHKITKSIWVSILLHAWSNTVLGGMYSLTSLCSLPKLKTLAVSLVQITIISLLYLFNKKSENNI